MTPFGVPVVPEVKHSPQGVFSSKAPHTALPCTCASNGSSAHTTGLPGAVPAMTAEASITTSRSMPGAASAICRASGSRSALTITIRAPDCTTMVVSWAHVRRGFSV